MAIQNRRGVYSDFTPSKMVTGELAVVQSGDPNNTSGKAVYAAFGASGDVKRLATEDDLSGKVDKVTGKGLSTNDYTTEEKNKLNGIASGAEVNVQSDWNQSNTSADDFIKNKPNKTSDFTNDGDGTSNFATESYVQLNGGKIDTISVNGTQQTITNKNVDIAVPIIDNTLTQTGKAADAKVVGDELANVKSDTKMQLDYVREDVDEVKGIIAQSEPTSTASQNYAVGDYLILNNQLYRVAVAISSGETITPGTNAELITLMSEVKSQGASIAANANAIATLQTAPYDLMSLYLQFLRTYANGSVSNNGRTFAVDKNKITITGTGSSTTFVTINLTGSVLKTRTGVLEDYILYDTDFVQREWMGAGGSVARSIITAIGTVYGDASPKNDFIIVTRTYTGDDPTNATITRDVVMQFASRKNIATILDTYLSSCTDFAIYYRSKSSASAAGEVIWQIDRIPILDAPTT